jgi:diadenosine tetraphosphate (Ap4A) HIT family hydrolase
VSGFALHPRLAADSHHLTSLALSELLLHRNAVLPWLILVPRVEHGELCDLERAQRAALDVEIDAACALLRREFPVSRLNVAAIGNVVPQLHVHVVGRHEGDACWPQPVWGHLSVERAWPSSDVARLARAARELCTG